MSEKKLTKEDFFKKNSIENILISDDPLFEKYKRKEFNGRNNYTEESRKYQSKKNDTNEESRIGDITSGLTEYTGAWTTSEVNHLLRRCTFGVKKTDSENLLSMSMSDAVDFLLNIDNTPIPPPINYYESLNADENGLAYGADWTNDPFDTYTFGFSTNYFRLIGLQFWNMHIALNSNLDIREKMTWFWYHFLPIDLTVVTEAPHSYVANNSARICYKYIQMFRNNALGNFKNIITEMATQPAMMFYLNNQANTKYAPDENFAREIMELFTLGKDTLSQYTETDVIEAAKILTGWRVKDMNTSTPYTEFDLSLHETSNKTFSTFFNDTVIPSNGADELTAFIDMIFTKEQVVSEYLCRKLYRYFVYYDIDHNIEANVIVPLALELVANNWDMMPVMRKLLKSEHFYDIANKGVYIKSPLDLVIGSLRTFNLPFNIADVTNHEAQNILLNDINNNGLKPIGQEMLSVPNVAGWVPFYQNPSFHQYWINSNTTQKRFKLIEYLFEGLYSFGGGLLTHMKCDVIAFAQQYPNTTIQDPNLLTDAFIQLLLPVDIGAIHKQNIKNQTLLSGLSVDSYWTTAWDDYTSDPTNTSYEFIVSNRLKNLLTTITQLAEYQLM